MKTCIAALAAAACWAAPALAEPPPASAFGRLPMVQQASISPDGKRVAILGGPADDRRVSIATIDQPDMPAFKLGSVETVSVTWAGDQYVIARVAYWDKIINNLAYRVERNIAINTNARAVSRLLEGVTGPNMMLVQPIIGVVAGPEPKAIVSGGGVIWRADVATGKGAIQEEGNRRTISWSVDSTGEARVRVDADNHDIWIMGRAAGAKAWRQVWLGQYGEDSPVYYYGYSEPDNAAYGYEEKDGVGHLVRRSLEDGRTEAVGPPVKLGEFDPFWDRNRKAIVGLVRMTDRPSIDWLDDELGAVHGSLAKLFPSQAVELESWSADRQRFVVRVTSPGDPPVWYLFDKSRKELSSLGEEYPELKGFKFGETRWLKYKARDGLEMSAYLTLPPASRRAVGKLPLIVLPHGGPQERDDFDFDFLTQFLASRGYAVLRPQFRGSFGFGRDFVKAGDGEWGGKMQTDLLDGVVSVAASGDIDPGRVCVVGASFGGYAALAAATLHPDSYRCAASFAGVSDLGLLIHEKSRAYGPKSGSAEAMRKMLGKAPLSLLASTSPARLANKAAIPVLLVHGDKDTVVPIEQSQLMARSMQAAGKPVEFVTLADENHYLTHSRTRTQLLEALDTFLAKNLPVQP
jgi:dipeptidyl aminopeptidase/acylaminoacyl peptidase